MPQAAAGAQPTTLRDLLTEQAGALGIPPDLALAMVAQESGGRQDATSPKGALGLFQLMPETAAELSVDPTDPIQNITGGLRYFKQQLDAHGGDVRLALAAYNAGPGAVEEAGGNVPDFPETQDYVTRVLEGWQGGEAAPAAAEAPGAPQPAPIADEPDEPEPEPLPDVASPVSRFLSETAQAGVIEPLKGIVAVVRGMWNEPGKTSKMIAGAVTEPTIRHLQAATQARRDGDADAWVSHMLRAIPIIGPIGEQIGEQMESGDVAGGTGRAVGTALTFMIPRALRGVRPRKPVGPVPLLKVEQAAEPGAVAGFMAHLAERTLPGSGVFRRFRARQQQALLSEGEKIAAEISAIPRNAVNSGQRVRVMIEQTRLDRQVAARQLYDMIDQMTETTTRRVAQTRTVPSTLVGPGGEALTTTERFLRPVEVGGVLVETIAIRRVAVPMLRKIRQESQLIHPDELARTTKLLEQMVRSPKRVPFSTVQAARSSLLGIVRSHGDPIPGKAGGAAKLLTQNVDNAMMRAARQSGIKELPGLVEEANALWRETKEIYNSTFLKGIADASPESVTGLIRGADIAELQLLQRALPQQTWNGARAGVMRDMLMEATSPPQTPTATSFSGRFGVTGEGAAVAPVQFSGRKLSEGLRKFGYDKSVELFGRRAVDQLDDLAALADRVKPGNTNWAATGLISAGINASLLAPILGPIVRPSMFLNPTVLAASVAWSASATVGFNLLARVLTRPEGLTAYRGFLHGMSVGNRPATIAAGVQVARMLEEEQAAMDDLGDPEVAAAAGVQP